MSKPFSLKKAIGTVGELDPQMGIWLAQRALEGDDCDRLLERLRHAVAELQRSENGSANNAQT